MESLCFRSMPKKNRPVSPAAMAQGKTLPRWANLLVVAHQSRVCATGQGNRECQLERQSHFQGSRDDPSCPKPGIGHEGAHREPRKWLYQSSRHSPLPNHQSIGGLKIYHSIDIHAILGPELPGKFLAPITRISRMAGIPVLLCILTAVQYFSKFAVYLAS